MEYVTGISLEEVPERPRRVHADVEQVAWRAFLRQLFGFGFFHAVPHPGSFLMLANDRSALVDFGLVGHVSQGERQTLAQLFQATLGGRCAQQRALARSRGQESHR